MNYRERLVRALVEVGRIEEEWARYDEAEATLHRAMELADADAGLRACVLTRQASVARELGRLDEAVALADEAVAAAAAGDDRVDALVMQGRMRHESDRLEEAQAVFEAAVAEAADGSPGAALARHGLAAVVRARGRYDEAIAMLREAAPLVDAVFGPDSLEAAAVRNDIGICCKFAGWFDEGVAAYSEALAIVEAAVGPAHPFAASLHHNLGGLAHARRDFEAAEPHARLSVNIRAELLGWDHLDVAADRVALAAILLDVGGRESEAEVHLLESLAVVERVQGPDHYEVGVIASNLGTLAQRLGRLDEAAEWHGRALAVKTAALGDGHPEVAISLNNLGVVRRRQGRLDEAASLYRRAVAALDGAVAPDHPTLAAVRRNLAKVEELSAG